MLFACLESLLRFKNLYIKCMYNVFMAACIHWLYVMHTYIKYIYLRTMRNGLALFTILFRLTVLYTSATAPQSGACGVRLRTTICIGWKN